MCALARESLFILVCLLYSISDSTSSLLALEGEID